MVTVALNCARQAAKMGVKRFIHLSTAQVYNSDKVMCAIGCCMVVYQSITAVGMFVCLGSESGGEQVRALDSPGQVSFES